MIKLFEKQKKLLKSCDSWLNILVGSVSSGKTFVSVLKWIHYIDSGQCPGNGEILMIGKSRDSLKRNILGLMETFCGDKFQYSLAKGEATLSGRKIHLVGANDERAEGKIRGVTAAAIYGDEITLWPDSFFNMSVSRLRIAKSRFIGATNPDSPYHNIKKNFIDRADKMDLACYNFLIDDNIFLDENYLKNIKAAYTGLWHKRFILGQWVVAEGAIYDFFDKDIHTTNKIFDFSHYYISCDYGTNNPCVFLLIGKVANWQEGQPKYIVFKEYYYNGRESGRQKTDSDYVDDLKTFLGTIKPVNIFIDPSASSFIVALERVGFIIEKADNSVIDGIRTVSAALKNGDILIHEQCENLIKEFGSYLWDAKAQKIGIDAPLKTNDHALDALRYFVYTMSRNSNILDMYNSFNFNR